MFNVLAANIEDVDDLPDLTYFTAAAVRQQRYSYSVLVYFSHLLISF